MAHVSRREACDLVVGSAIAGFLVVVRSLALDAFFLVHSSLP